jgi:ATP-dependent DNA ligase
MTTGSLAVDRVRYRHYDESIFLCAFDLVELNGDDPRPDPLEGRKATLEMTLAKAGLGTASTSTLKATARPYFATPASSPRRGCLIDHAAVQKNVVLEE